MVNTFLLSEYCKATKVFVFVYQAFLFSGRNSQRPANVDSIEAIFSSEVTNRRLQSWVDLILYIYLEESFPNIYLAAINNFNRILSKHLRNIIRKFFLLERKREYKFFLLVIKCFVVFMSHPKLFLIGQLSKETFTLRNEISSEKILSMFKSLVETLQFK